ncbi:MAG: alpha/beta hydrolase [Bacteroidia bacterium]
MQVSFSNGTIRYKAEGQGPAIVFLHGFMETAKIWRPFVSKLSSKFRVIRINLPGHGKSSTFGETHSMEFMSDVVRAVLEAEGVIEALIVGHSMGGYVALAFAETFPHKVKGLVLFSSTCFEDTPERKIDRERSIKAAEAHKMKYITSVIPNLFFERSGMKASKRIFKLVKIAAKQPKEGITAAIRGMKDRVDRSEVLRNANFPLMYIAGQDDFLIPLERVQEMHRLRPDAIITVLENCGHVGFIEQKQECIKAIQTFALEKIL